MLVLSIVPPSYNPKPIRPDVSYKFYVGESEEKKIKERKSCLKSRKTKGFKHLPEHWMLKIKIEESYPDSIPYFPAPPFSSVQFSWSVMTDSLQPHDSQHASPPCPSPAPGVHSNSCPLSR